MLVRTLWIKYIVKYLSVFLALFIYFWINKNLLADCRFRKPNFHIWMDAVTVTRILRMETKYFSERWFASNTGRSCQPRTFCWTVPEWIFLRSRVFSDTIQHVRDRCLRQEWSKVLFIIARVVKIMSTSTLKHILNAVQSKHDSVLYWTDNLH